MKHLNETGQLDSRIQELKEYFQKRGEWNAAQIKILLEKPLLYRVILSKQIEDLYDELYKFTQVEVPARIQHRSFIAAQKGYYQIWNPAAVTLLLNSSKADKFSPRQIKALQEESLFLQEKEKEKFAAKLKKHGITPTAPVLDETLEQSIQHSEIKPTAPVLHLHFGWYMQKLQEHNQWNSSNALRLAKCEGLSQEETHYYKEEYNRIKALELAAGITDPTASDKQMSNMKFIISEIIKSVKELGNSIMNLVKSVASIFQNKSESSLNAQNIVNANNCVNESSPVTFNPCLPGNITALVSRNIPQYPAVNLSTQLPPQYPAVNLSTQLPPQYPIINR